MSHQGIICTLHVMYLLHHAHTLPEHRKPCPGSEAGGTRTVQVSVREAFTAPRGRVLVAADYRQIEARVLAHFSKV
jgi:hypothetical protein